MFVYHPQIVNNGRFAVDNAASGRPAQAAYPVVPNWKREPTGDWMRR